MNTHTYYILLIYIGLHPTGTIGHWINCMHFFWPALSSVWVSSKWDVVLLAVVHVVVVHLGVVHLGSSIWADTDVFLCGDILLRLLLFELLLLLSLILTLTALRRRHGLSFAMIGEFKFSLPNASNFEGAKRYSSPPTTQAHGSIKKNRETNF